MPIYKVNLGFAELSDPALDAFAENVIAKLTGNLTFPTPPLDVASLTALVKDFTDTMAAAADGGKSETIMKDEARAALIYALRQDAQYVQSNGNNDPVTLLSSGYSLSSTNRASSPLDTPTIEGVANGASTTLVVKVTPIRNAKAYDVQYSSDNGATWVFGASAPKSTITVTSLVPGTTYQIRLRAVGGATGFSDWSDPVSHMAT